MRLHPRPPSSEATPWPAPREEEGELGVQSLDIAAQPVHSRLAHVLLEDDGAWLGLLDKLVRVECLEEQEEA